jgi:aspartyl protease family protein
MQVSSGTISLFSSVVLAIVGATGLAWAMKHPGTITSLMASVLPKTAPQVHTQQALTATEEPVNTLSNPGAQGTVTLEAGDHGHFFAEVEINGRSVDVLVDTGATLVALTSEDAQRAGIFVHPSDFTHTVSTANGVARVAPVTIDEISIGDITVRNIRAAVAERGKLAQTLLGMSFLSRLSRVDMRDGALILQE